MSRVNSWNDHVAMYMLSIGVIEVDSEGHIWKVKDGRGKPYIWRDIKPQRAEREHPKGYLQVKLCFNGKRYHVYAHRIAWLFHNGLIPKGLEINHKNGIRDDNRLANLELVTASENQKHGYQVNGRIPTRGEQAGNSKLTETQVREIRGLFGEITQRALGKIYGVSQENISLIINRKRWKHI